MTESWKADPAALFDQRLGKSAKELGHSKTKDDCPDIWRLDNGDVAVIGTDLTEAYASRMPDGVTLGAHERLVVLPGNMLSVAKGDIPDV
jgi:hypothetical protein